MPRPEMTIVKEQLELQRAAIIATFEALSFPERMAQAQSYETAEAQGQAIFHPFHLCFS
jgi:hypothetical protein